jgi:hypothetical protein
MLLSELFQYIAKVEPISEPGTQGCKGICSVHIAKYPAFQLRIDDRDHISDLQSVGEKRIRLDAGAVVMRGDRALSLSGDAIGQPLA